MTVIIGRITSLLWHQNKIFLFFFLILFCWYRWKYFSKFSFDDYCFSYPSSHSRVSFVKIASVQRKSMHFHTSADYPGPSLELKTYIGCSRRCRLRSFWRFYTGFSYCFFYINQSIRPILFANFSSYKRFISFCITALYFSWTCAEHVIPSQCSLDDPRGTNQLSLGPSSSTY